MRLGYSLAITVVLTFHCLTVLAENPRAREHAPVPVDDALQVKLNRVRTEHGWAGIPIKFPCEAEIEQRKKQGLKLPSIIINGETHTDPYCIKRRKLLLAMGKHEQGIYCVADEGKTAPFGTLRDSRLIKGLENPLVKDLSVILISYQALKVTNPDSYAITFPAPRLLNSDFVDLLKNQATDSEEIIKLKSRLRKLRQKMDKIGNELSGDKYQSEYEKIISTAQAITNSHKEQVADLFAEGATELASQISFQERSRESVPVPLGLKREVQFAIQAIDNQAKFPNDPVCKKKTEECFLFRNRWRDRLMAVNLAIAYCENLKETVPKSEVHAIVGENHREPMFNLLVQAVNKDGIQMFQDNGSELGALYSSFKGQPEKGGKYPNEAIKRLSTGGQYIGYSVQKDDVRVIVLESSLDPLPGTTLNSASGPKIVVFGRTKDIGEFYNKTGLDGTKVSAMAAQIRKAYHLNNQRVDSFPWLPPGPAVAEKPAPKLLPAVAEKPK